MPRFNERNGSASWAAVLVLTRNYGSQTGMRVRK